MGRPLIAGSILFSAGVLLLLWTNYLRFGRFGEFGHTLNLHQLYGLLYATRFNHPFEDAPLHVVTWELIGAMFFNQKLNGADWYAQGLFLGQSSVVRWREFYFTTYDWFYLVLIIVAFVLLIRDVRRARTFGIGDRWWMIGLWGFLSILPNAVFFLRTAPISSRYLIDFAPAIAAVIGYAWIRSVADASRWLRRFLLAGLLAFVAIESTLIKSAYSPPVALNWSEVMQSRELFKRRASLPFPKLGMASTQPGASKIPFDGAGWDEDTKFIKPLVTVFVEDPRFLEIEVAGSPNTKTNPEWFRATIGLEHLEREKIEAVPGGWRIRFSGPRNSEYRRGLQVAFIATVPRERLASDATPWLLRRVQWRVPVVTGTDMNSADAGVSP